MKAERILLLLAVLFCSACSTNDHTEPDDNPDNAITIYDLFPDYNRYDNLYHVAGCVAMENITTGQIKEFPAEEAGLLIKAAEPEWKIPDNAPYLSNAYFGVIRLIMSNEVCYKEVFEIFPNYFYYECLYYIEKVFELENIETKELKGFNVHEAERMLRNPNWKIPQNAPYVLDFAGSYGLHLYRISEMCRALSAK